MTAFMTPPTIHTGENHKKLKPSTAPLNWTQQCQRRFYNRGSGVWLALAVVPWRKLVVPIVRVTDFGPAVMLPAGILHPNQSC